MQNCQVWVRTGDWFRSSRIRYRGGVRRAHESVRIQMQSGALMRTGVGLLPFLAIAMDQFCFRRRSFLALGSECSPSNTGKCALRSVNPE